MRLLAGEYDRLIVGRGLMAHYHGPHIGQDLQQIVGFNRTFRIPECVAEADMEKLMEQRVLGTVALAY